MKIIRHIFAGLLAALLMFTATMPVSADLRSAPLWYDQNGVNLAPDWHYRVSVTVPAGTAVNATVSTDLDFAALLGQMGVTGTFDPNSPRIVRPNGTLVTTQEFTDTVFGGATDATGNARGETRFIAQDAGGSVYMVYFDITENGTKPANPQAPINGNFERGGAGALSPTGWATTTATAGIDAQIRGSEFVNVTANPAAVDGVQTRNTNGQPRTGDFSYLLGNRSNAAGGIAGNPGVTMARSFTIPATGAGNLNVRWRPEGWDSGNFDPIRIDIINAGGTVLAEIVGPTAANYGTKPFGPNNGNAVATATQSGYRQYNGFDCNLAGGHMLVPPMTVACRSETWFTATQSLTAWAGQTVSVRVRFFSDNADKSWYHIDDFEWSVVAGVVGAPQSFGVNIVSPVAASAYSPGQAIPLTVQVDANPAAATTPVTASLFDSANTQIAGPFTLYNDGTHGDALAGDAIWSNNNSVPADPAPTIPITAPPGSGYVLRVFGRDGATSGGLARIPSAPVVQTQDNYWNIDQISFSVQTAVLALTKSSTVISDLQNGTSNPKMVPGAVVRYCVLVTNAGPLGATNLVSSDPLPASLAFVPGSIRSGASCAAAATIEDDDALGADENDPSGANFSGGLVTMSTPVLASGATLAFTLDAIIQ
jgi:uncharacterized repeat protein (TIGR01451 family)